MELVSAVISTYRRPVEILRRAVESVLRQTWPAMELIVVNDCPEDRELSENIRQMLNALDPKILYLVHEKNQGACAARNTGLAAAKGSYVAFLDDDDEWLPEKIEKQMACMTGDVALVRCDSWQISENGVRYQHLTVPSKDPLSAILRSNFIGSTSFPLLRTECVRAVGGFDPNVKVCQDYDLWIRMVSHYGLAYVPEPLVNYYVSQDSTFRWDGQKYIDGVLFLTEKYRDLYEGRPDDYLFALNNGALTGLLMRRDPSIYRALKKAAFRYRFWNRYNFFLLPMKVFGKVRQKLQSQGNHANTGDAI